MLRRAIRASTRLSRRFAARLKLQVVEPSIVAGFVEQLGVGADLLDATSVHHDDLIGGQDRREPMRDGDHRAAGRKRSSACWICFSDSESSDEVASSRRRIGAFFNKARAMASRCC